MDTISLLGSDWKLTLPIGRDGQPIEIMPNELPSYSSDYFYYSMPIDAYVFKTPTNGVRSKTSKYSRCELRQMNSDGTLASWSTSTGTRSMEVELMVTAMPIGQKKDIVLAQIHGGEDDLTTFRFIGRVDSALDGDLWITDGDNSRAYRIGPVQLQERIRIGFFVQNGIIRYAFNGSVVPFSLNRQDPSCYFKTGCYLNVNTVTPLQDGEPDFGTVAIFRIEMDNGEAQPPANGFEAEVKAELKEIKALLIQAIDRNERRIGAIKSIL